MVRKQEPLRRPASKRNRGFTLVEVLAAIAVLSVASWIIIAMFTGSLRMNRTSRNQEIATSLAEECLLRLQNEPSAFAWPELAPGGEAVEITLKSPGDADAYPGFEAPAATPVRYEAMQREEQIYEGFTWQALAAKTDEIPGGVTVTVVISWEEARRELSLPVTTVLPANLWEAAS